MQKTDSNKTLRVLTEDVLTLDAVSFEDLLDMDEVQRIQDVFASTMGVACQILRPNGTFITERSNYCRLCGDIIRGNKRGLSDCTNSDKSLGEVNPQGLNIYRCRNTGLLEAGVPIFVDGKHIATWGLGQVNDGTQTEEGIRAYAQKIGVDADLAAAAFKEVTVMSQERFKEVAHLMQVIADQLATTGHQNLQQSRLIEEQKIMQYRVEESEAHYRLLAENTLDVIWTMDMNLTFTYVNPSIFYLTGYRQEEWVGRRLPGFCSATSFAEIQKIIAREISLAAEDHRGVIFETQLLRKDGSTVDVEIHGKITFTSDGKPSILQGTTRDVSERKKVERELRYKEYLLSTAQEMGHIGTWNLDLVNNILTWTEENYRIFGVVPETPLTYEIFLNCVHPDDRDFVNREWNAHLKTNDYDIEHRLLVNGEVRWVREKAEISFGENGVPISAIGFTQNISQRKRSEERLAMITQAVENSNEAFDIVSEDGLFVDVNRAYVNMWGYDSAEEILGTSPAAHCADPNLPGHIIAELKQTGAFQGEFLARRKDGSLFWVLMQAHLDYDGHGREIYPTKSIDITERKKAQDALQSERDRLDYIIEASRLGTWAWNIKDNTAEFNEMWATLLGYTMDELGPSSYELWKSLGHPDDVPKIEKLLQRCATGETLDYSSEFRMRHKDGHWVWILDRGRVMTHDDDNKPLEMFGTHADVTPLIQAEEELRRSEAKFRSYVEQAPYGVFIADVSGHYVDTNPAASQLTGYTPDELLNLSFRDLCHPEDMEKGAAHFAKVLESGFADSDIPFVCKDGTRKLWNVTAVRLNKDHILGFVNDITDQEEMEKQIRSAQKLDAIGQLAGGVAHDFNNLLMGIMGYTELCLDEVKEENSIREWLMEIMHEAQRSAEIVKQLLAFSRKQTIAPRILNLNDSVENMLKMLRRLIGEDVDLLWQPGGGLSEIKIDPGQVDQILANLCVNARDAIGGVGKVTIETANMVLDEDYCTINTEAIPGSFVMLAVSDSGAGMDAGTVSRVFEPFFTTKPEGEGTGLGLATVYGIVKQNGGFINVYSEVEEGSTFRIYLPSCSSTSNDLAVDTLPPAIPGGEETLLVVEDQQAICHTIRLFLKPLGYTVHTAESPTKALEIMDEIGDEVDVLITDVVMPGMNGRQLAEKLQEMKPELKVLYMSGYTTNVIVHRGILEEGVNFLSKPIARNELARKLRSMLDGRIKNHQDECPTR